MKLIPTIRAAARRLLASPAHSVVCVTILAVGIGATLFLFGGVNSYILRPMPFPHAERLVEIGLQSHEREGSLDSLDADDWLRLLPLLDSFDALAIDGGAATVNLARGAGVTRYNGALIDSSLLSMLGTEPLLGRGLLPSDDAPGAPLVVLLGERVWRNDFNADPAVIGSSLRANGEAATVVGVLPEDFAFPNGQQVWIPRRIASGDEYLVAALGRLAPGVSMEQAQQQLAALEQRLRGELTGIDDHEFLTLQPLSARFVDDYLRRMLWAMFGAGALVLLLACANVANLQLARLATRRRELAVRGALGASRRQLVAELLAETFLLGLVATLLGALLNHFAGIWVFASMAANENVPAYYVTFTYDWRDFAAVAVCAVAAGLLAGLVPALRAAGGDVQAALRDGDKGSGGFFARISRALVVGEIALTVVLLVGAAMFIRGINGMLDFDFGTRAVPTEVLTARVGLFPAGHPTPEAQYRFFQDAVAALGEQPAVLAASAATALPGSASDGRQTVAAEGAAKPGAGWTRVDTALADPGFAEVYEVALSEGRFIESRDVADSEPVTVIDRRLAQALWPDGTALGQRLRLDPDDPESPLLTVVGVFNPLHLRSAGDLRLPALLRPLAQQPVRFATLAVRLRGDAAAFAPQLAASVRSIDADTPVYWVRTQAEAIRLGRVGPVLLAQIFSSVGLLALGLAAVGLYGVLAFAVVQRTREIGIRRAIGASRSGVVALVVRRIGWQVCLGLGIGVLLGLPWSALLSDPTVTGEHSDPLIFASVIGMILLVASLSALVPLRRALRVDPLVALRQE